MNYRVTRKCGVCTQPGTMRVTNEDRSLFLTITDDKGYEFIVAVVADGLGGQEGGKIASEAAVQTIKMWWEERMRFIFQDIDILRVAGMEFVELFFSINEHLLSASIHTGQNMSTTLSVLFLYRGDYVVCHMGNSRIYRLKRSSPAGDTSGQFSHFKQPQHELILITKDDFWLNEQVHEGRMTQFEADQHAQKHLLMHSLGINENVQPYICRGKFNERDYFLLCTDGFYTMVKEDQVQRAISQYRCHPEMLQLVCDELVQMAFYAGGQDNMTLLLVDPPELHIGEMKALG